jgi:hypothetical protein
MSNKIQSVFEAAIGLRTRIADRIQGVEPLPRKALESLGLFLVLATIYSFYLKELWSVPTCQEITFDFGYLLRIVKFLFLTGWPFALLALLDDTWSSKDAGRVFLASFIATNAFWMHHYHHMFCPFSFAFVIFPYVFGAMVGNAIGSWTQTSRGAVEEYSL